MYSLKTHPKLFGAKATVFLITNTN